MTDTHSPFFVIQDFISPLMCETLVDNLNCYEPDTDKNDHPISSSVHHDKNEGITYNALQDHIDAIRDHFRVDYRGMEKINFEWYPHACEQADVRCENAVCVRNTWVRNQDRDLTGILFFSDYQDNIPFDSNYEVYGGKVEFPQWGFGFNPQRGTLIVFPSGPHFLNAVNTIYAGDSFLARFHIACQAPFVFQPANFPGSYTDWFADTV